MLSNLQASLLWVLEKHTKIFKEMNFNEKKNPHKRHAYGSSHLRLCTMGGHSSTR